tara:strand:+ start:65 stop:424 length:360 start_codon:yes stop_codon:yes gene_type:complete
MLLAAVFSLSSSDISGSSSSSSASSLSFPEMKSAHIRDFSSWADCGMQRLSSILVGQRPKTAVVCGFESSKSWSISVKSHAVGVADDNNDDNDDNDDDDAARGLLLALGSMSLKCTWRK